MIDWIKEYEQTNSVENQKALENTPVFDYSMWEDYKDTAAMSATESLLTDAIFSEKVNEQQYHDQNKNVLKAKGLEDEYLRDYRVFEKLTKEQRKKYDNALKTNNLSFLKDYKDKQEAEKYGKEFNSYKKINDLIKNNTDLKMNSYESIENNVTRDITNFRKARAEREKSGKSFVGDIVGSIAGVIADPINTATLFVPVGGAYKAGYSLLSNIAFSAGKTAAFEMGVEAANQYTHILPYRRDYLGDNYTVVDAATNVGFAGLGGAVFGAIFDGVGHFMTKKEIDNLNLIKQKHEELLRDKETMTVEEVDAIHAIEEAVAATNGLKDVKMNIDEKELINKNAENWANARLQAAKGEEINLENNVLALTSFKDRLNNPEDIQFKQEIGEDLYNFIQENKEIILKDNKTFNETLKTIDDMYSNHNTIKNNLTKSEMTKLNNTMKMTDELLENKRVLKRINNNNNKLFRELKKYIKDNNYNVSKLEVRAKANEILAEQVLVDKLAKQDIVPQPKNMDIPLETKKINNELKKEGLTTDKDIASVKLMDEALQEQAIIDNSPKIGDNIEEKVISKEEQDLKDILESSGIGEEYKKLLEEEKALDELIACGI